MNSSFDIEDLIDWVISKKSLHSWTLQDLSNITGYSINGIKKAIDKKTIKYDSILKIVDKKDLREEFQVKFGVNKSNSNQATLSDPGIFLEKDGVKFSVREIAEFVLDNEDAFFKDRVFKIWFKENMNHALDVFIKENNLERIVVKKGTK